VLHDAVGVSCESKQPLGEWVFAVFVLGRLPAENTNSGDLFVSAHQLRLAQAMPACEECWFARFSIALAAKHRRYDDGETV